MHARLFTSAGTRLQATLAAADVAAEEILDAARAEARELIERAEQVATDRTAQLQTQAEILLTRANDLTRQAQALGEATRELTSSVNRVISIEAPAVTELELPAGETPGAPQLEPAAEETADAAPEAAGEAQPASGIAEPDAAPPAAEADLAETDPVLAELGAIADSRVPAPPAETPEPEVQAPAAEAAPEPEPEAEAEASAAEAAAPEPDAPTPAAEAAAPTAEPPQAAAPARGSGSQPPPSPPKPAEPQPAAEPEEPRKKRGLFSRLIRHADEEQPGEAPRQTRRPRASAEAIAEVSPGHQMLARQMLLDGLGEADVERRLRDEFRVRDPGAVLDSLQLDAPVISPTKAEGTNERES